MKRHTESTKDSTREGSETKVTQITDEIVRQMRKGGGRHNARYVGVAEERRDIPGGVAAISDEGEALLLNFSVHVIVDQEMNYTTVGGRFSPATSIDLTRQAVILSVAGANSLRLSLPCSSFSKTGLDGYVARVRRGLLKTDILIQPFSGGDWAYSAGIDGFVPGSTSIIVGLTIGSQAGRAAGAVYVF